LWTCSSDSSLHRNCPPYTDTACYQDASIHRFLCTSLYWPEHFVVVWMRADTVCQIKLDTIIQNIFVVPVLIVHSSCYLVCCIILL
jgi:hypothetical protein